MERSQFTFYDSFFQSVSRIRKKSARADAYDAICNYALFGILPDIDAMEDAAAIAFLGAKPNIDASRRKAESGCKGGTIKKSESKPEANSKQTGSKNKNKNKNKIKNKNKCYNAREEIDSAFNAFWEAYPKKVGKTDARKAFEKVELPVEVLLDAINRHKNSAQWTQDGGQYIPNPATWLNQERWEDELPADQSIPKGATGLGAAEIEAIQRVIQEGE